MALDWMLDRATKPDTEIGKPSLDLSPVNSRAILGETDEAPDPVMQGCGSRWFRRRQPEGWELLLDILGLPAGGPLTPWPDDPRDEDRMRACGVEARQDQARIVAEMEETRQEEEFAARLDAYARKPPPQPPAPPRPSLDWMRDGACAGDDVTLYYGQDGERASEREAREDEAVRTCGYCPVLDTCLTHALTMPERWGVWGGMGEDERAAHRRRLVRRGLLPSVDDQPRGDGKPCPHCGVTKPFRDFYYDRARPDGLSYRCRTCLTTQRRAKQVVA